MELIGDLGCAGVDVADWQSQNRLALLRDSKTRWLLAYSPDGMGSYEQMVADVLEAFGHWFGDQGLQRLRDLTYNATDEGYRRGVASRIRIRTYVNYELSWPDVTARFDRLPSPPSVRSGSVLYVWVEFDYHGNAPDMPWPVFNQDAWTSGGKNCPYASTIMLAVQAKSPDPREVQNVTENPVSFFPREGAGLIVTQAAEGATSISQGASDAIDPLFGKLMLAGGAFIGWYALTTKATVSRVTNRSKAASGN